MSRSEFDHLVRALPADVLPRRRFLKQALALGLSASAVGSSLAACGSGTDSGDDGGGALRLAVYPYIPNVIDLDKIIKAYQAKNQGVEVSVTPLATDITTAANFVQKFTLEARQKKASYDLIFGPTPWIEVAPLAKAGALEPIGKLVGEQRLADLIGPARDGVTYSDGEIYSLPTWTDVVGFIHRSDMLQKFGAQPPSTWDEVVSTAGQLKSKLPSGTYSYGADWGFMHRSFLPIFVTLADKPFTDKGIVNLDDPAAVEAFELLRTLHPSMPPNASKNLGSSETFQAGKLAMETYWQAQYTRAIKAGLSADVVKMTSNPRGRRDSTLFWSTDVVIPKHAANKEMAAKFWVDGFLGSSEALQASVDTAGKILPYSSAANQVKVPEYMQALAEQLKSGTPIPMTDAYLKFEQPAYKEQVERMILRNQSARDTVANLKDAFKQGAGG